MEDDEEGRQAVRNRHGVPSINEAGGRTVMRRASTPAPNELAMVPSRSQWTTYQRIPLPLPYLPSDYEPSQASSKQRIFHPDFLRNHQQSLLPPPSLLQINSSSWDSSPTRQQQQQQSTRPRSRSIDSGRIKPEPSRTQQLSIVGSHHNHDNLELVPYRDWTVIAENNFRGDLVLYNPETRMVTVQTQDSPDRDIAPSDPMEIVQRIVTCPYCHRAFENENSMSELNQPDFMDTNYFRLLSPVPTHEPIRESATATPDIASENDNESAAQSANHLKENAFNQGYYQKFFTEEKKLGRGLRGSVYLCQHELDGVNLGQYAIKKVAVGDNHPWLVRMLREVHLMEQLRHPNIVNYKHSWLEYHRFSDFGPKVPCLFILMECANGGNLEEYVEPSSDPDSQNIDSAIVNESNTKLSKREKIKQKFLEQQRFEQLLKQQEQTPTDRRILSLYEIWSFFFDTLEGLAHLHRHNIVHRDLKPPNLLIKYDDRDASRTWVEHVDGTPVRRRIPRILISDFGECEVLDDLSQRDRTGATGTLEFMAPELIRLDDHGKYLQEFSSKADMWSLGMVLFYLCYSRLPYHYINDIDRLKDEILSFDKVTFPSNRSEVNTNSPHANDHIPVELKHIIRALLSLDPETRPSCDEILEKIGHLKPKAPNAPTNASDGNGSGSSFSMPRMRLGNGLGIHGKPSSVPPYHDVHYRNATRNNENYQPALSGTDAQGVKIERIPSDMGHADRVLSEKREGLDEDDVMQEDDRWLREHDPLPEGTRKRRRKSDRTVEVSENNANSGSGPSSDNFVEESERLKQLLLESPELPHDTQQLSMLAMRILAIVPESHREMADFWMRSASEVDWRKLLKAVAAILKVSCRTQSGLSLSASLLKPIAPKVVTSTYPCYPYMMSSTSLYPMVAMALLDIYS
ncbi:putative serine/threonine-protein kinase iks1 [Umbelopsis sp. WA50703]